MIDQAPEPNTPTTEEVRRAYDHEWSGWQDTFGNEEALAEFDRWLGKLERDIRADQRRHDANIVQSITSIPMHSQWGDVVATAILEDESMITPHPPCGEMDCVVHGIAASNKAQSDALAAADRAGTNDRADVTSGSGYSRYDHDEER